MRACAVCVYGAHAGVFTWPMAASGWTTAAGWMKLVDASLADPSEAPAGRRAWEAIPHEGG